MTTSGALRRSRRSSSGIALGLAVPRPDPGRAGRPVGRPDHRGLRDQPDQVGPADAAEVRRPGQLRDARRTTHDSGRRSATRSSTRSRRCRSGSTLGLGIAMALNQRIRGISWIRTAYFLPVVTSTVAIALVWSWIYSPEFGTTQRGPRVLRVPAQRWISDPFWAMPSIVAMSVWQGLGITVIIFLAGLQAIPDEYHDAAAVDGAGRWAELPPRDPAPAHAGDLLHRDPRAHRQLPGLRSGLRPGPTGQADRVDGDPRVHDLRERLPELQDGLCGAASTGSCSSSWRA